MGLRLLPLSLAEWRHHRWRHAVALLAVALGVALAASVQMINASALAEFSQAVRAVNGQPDATLAADVPGGLDDAWFGRLATDPDVASASPVLTLDGRARVPAAPGVSAPVDTLGVSAPVDTLGVSAPVDTLGVSAPVSTPGASAPAAAPLPLRLVGVDALVVAQSAADLMPQPSRAEGLADVLAADALYLNAAARQSLGVADGATVAVQSALGWQAFRVAGSVAAPSGPLAVLDIAAAQQRFERLGRLTRIDLMLVPGTDRRRWQAQHSLPAGTRWAAPDEAVQRVSNLSRAYRVNLSVLAAVALLVGGFLVYSVVSLSVAQRTPQLALLGVLGLAAADRRRWVLAESLLLGLVGSALGLLGGAGLAALALRALGGDLGGGYFPGLAPTLRWPLLELAACGALGTLATVGGAWWPARQAEALAPAQALKGLGPTGTGGARGAGGGTSVAAGLGLLATAGLLALAPPVAGLPLAAYASVALLLAGGVALVPVVVGLAVGQRPVAHGVLRLLALRRAHHARHTASAMVAGVVASLALSVAITVMVASFRNAVQDWLDSVLPADLYARSAGSGVGAEQASLPPPLLRAIAALPGVQRSVATRHVALQLAPQQPAVNLMARPLAGQVAQALPMLGPLVDAAPGTVAVYASEPAAALYRLVPGSRLVLSLAVDEAAAAGPTRTRQVAVTVAGIWRDYARQFGALAIDLDDYQRLTGDRRLNDLALWLAPGASPAQVQQQVQGLAGSEHPLDITGTQQLRALSLRIFDRSFAVTVYLQAVAIGVGLVGVAASLSAQVLARRKEFGLLAHLGLTRAQVLRLVALESATWLGAGVLLGLLLGLAMAVVLVKVVNPQSFHWTMPLTLPALRLALLCGAVLAAGTLTAAWSARRAAGRHAVLAVKEDW